MCSYVCVHQTDVIGCCVDLEIDALLVLDSVQARAHALESPPESLAVDEAGDDDGDA